MPATTDLGQALAQLAARQSLYRRYREYYDGLHCLRFATERWRSTFGSLFQAFADNLCPCVIDAVADRLELTGFASEQGEEDAGDEAWRIWQRNRMDRDAGEVHLEALTAGDGWVIVWPNPEGEATIYPQRAALMTAAYDEERPGRMLWAAKGWVTGAAGFEGRVRVNLYYAGRIEKYVSVRKEEGLAQLSAASFEPYAPEPTLPNEWGVVPVFHFANNAPMGAFGCSELRNVIPLQDALNKSVLDMLVAMEFAAYRQRWVTGMDAEIDEVTGKPKPPYEPGINRLWGAGEGVEFGEFAAADLSQFTGVSDSFRMEIARVSGTPVHYLMLQGGSPPSGEALKTLEARLIKKCRDRQSAFGNVWEDAMRLALRMERAAGEGAEISSQWVDPAPRSEKEWAETVEIRERVGISQKQALRELGYSDTRIEEMAEEKSEQTSSLGESVLTAFERGAGA